MSDNKKNKDKKNNHAKEPTKEQTELDNNEKTQNQEHRKPMRFQFGHDAKDEDIEKFLDMILGPEPKKNNEENNQVTDSDS